ncbi:MAG: T9SS type A sorting domain-containing protein [Sphingobacteriales bacterium]|nr:MAG: T9SS type A sorting domain-containing protein [Sphingobacteriales bacterium]
MNRLVALLIVLLIISQSKIEACTCPDTAATFRAGLVRMYRASNNLQPTHHILMGIIVSDLAGGQGGRMVVLEQLHGPNALVGDTIILRNGDGIGCLGGIPQSNLSDTVIASLVMINDSFHPYQQPQLDDGDYVTDLCSIAFMPVHQDSVFYWDENPGFSLSDLKDSIDSFFDNILAIDEVTDQVLSPLFPNPFLDRISILSKEHNFKSVSCYDLYGRLKFTKPLRSNYDSYLDVSELPSGIYVFKLLNRNGRYYQTKMVKK